MNEQRLKLHGLALCLWIISEYRGFEAYKKEALGDRTDYAHVKRTIQDFVMRQSNPILTVGTKVGSKDIDFRSLSVGEHLQLLGSAADAMFDLVNFNTPPDGHYKFKIKIKLFDFNIPRNTATKAVRAFLGLASGEKIWKYESDQLFLEHEVTAVRYYRLETLLDRFSDLFSHSVEEIKIDLNDRLERDIVSIIATTKPAWIRAERVTKHYQEVMVCFQTVIKSRLSANELQQITGIGPKQLQLYYDKAKELAKELDKPNKATEEFENEGGVKDIVMSTTIDTPTTTIKLMKDDMKNSISQTPKDKTVPPNCKMLGYDKIPQMHTDTQIEANEMMQAVEKMQKNADEMGALALKI